MVLNFFNNAVIHNGKFNEGELYMKTNTLRNLMFFGVAALPVIAQAGPPIPFGTTYTYDTAGGPNPGLQDVIYNTAAADAAGFVVGANPIHDDGFAQFTLTDKVSGETFFQTIIGGGSIQGNDSQGTVGFEFFDTESFVKINAAGGTGIAVNQTVDDLRLGTNAGTLQSGSVILTGADFLGAADNWKTVALTQTVTDAVDGNPATAGFDTGFVYDAYQDNLNDTPDPDNVGSFLRNDITGVLKLNQNIDPGDASFDDNFDFASVSTALDGAAQATVQSSSLSLDTSVNLGVAVDDQNFQYEKRVGNDTSGQLSYIAGANLVGHIAGTSVAGSGGFGAVGDFNDANSIDWVVGDTVDRVYIAQTVLNAGDFGFGSLADRADIDGAGPDDQFHPVNNADEYQSIFSLADGGHPQSNFTDDPFD